LEIAGGASPVEPDILRYSKGGVRGIRGASDCGLVEPQCAICRPVSPRCGRAAECPSFPGRLPLRCYFETREPGQHGNLPILPQVNRASHLVSAVCPRTSLCADFARVFFGNRIPQKTVRLSHPDPSLLSFHVHLRLPRLTCGGEDDEAHDALLFWRGATGDPRGASGDHAIHRGKAASVRAAHGCRWRRACWDGFRSATLPDRLADFRGSATFHTDRFLSDLGWWR
jgi:hypothetical protein